MLIGDVWISPPMVAELSELTSVHVTTVRRWLRTKKLPEATYQLLDLLQNGSIARIHPAWSGWRLCPRDGVLIPPNGSRPFAPGHLCAMQLNYQRIAAMRNQIRELKKQLRDSQTVAEPKPVALVGR